MTGDDLGKSELKLIKLPQCELESSFQPELRFGEVEQLPLLAVPIGTVNQVGYLFSRTPSLFIERRDCV